MCNLLKLNILNIILCLNIAVLRVNAKTISNNHSQDNTILAHTLNGQREFDLSESPLSAITQGSLEETIVAADAFEFTTPYASPIVAWDTDDKLLENTLLKLKTESDEHSCIMDNIKTVFIWWCYNNGSLRETNLSVWPKEQQMDLSFHNITTDEDLLLLSGLKERKSNILALSVAYNNLTAVPYFTLKPLANTLRYLSLKGNPFMDLKRDLTGHNNPCYLSDDGVHLFESQGKSVEGIAWALFPHMPSLIELDISNCHIEFITNNAFQNLTNLKSLYMSHNKMLTIPSDVFFYLPQLQILDLSFTNVHDSFMDRLIASPTLESVLKLIYGVTVQQNVFKYLPNLVYLDLSHTKLTRSSAVAFTFIGPSLKYMSLCYTSFPVFGNGLFKNTSLVGLDISGNNLAAFSITEDVFEGMPDSLMYLYFERSNLKDLSWLKHLSNLRFLGLAGNNINTLSGEHFKNLKQLQALDLSSNQVGNWYSQVFKYNKNLRILSLRDNNINIITTEMLKDFSFMVYLSLGDNDFICDCLLRDLVEIAAANNQKAICKGTFWSNFKSILHLNINKINTLWKNSRLNTKPRLQTSDITSMMWSQNMVKFRRTYKKLRNTYSLKAKPKLRFILDAFKHFNKTQTCTDSPSNEFDYRFNGSFVQLQLIDYEEEHYWCYNETERQHLIRLNCQRSSMVQDIEEELNSLTTYVWASVGTLIAMVALGILIYWKRWHIYYYYSSLKSAALLSAVSEDHINKFNSLYADNPNMIYDIFISYCQSDRDWIVEELMPNVEESGDISICLHERDFQVGITILDNIVSCMERSRALMLIISSNFLLSHWCQFEMHMAQHRLFELKRDHLLLVLLEDIPRCKRPKNLQYLMEVKTYIKWPGGKGKKSIHPEERKLFWKRLKRTLKQIGLNPLESKA